MICETVSADHPVKALGHGLPAHTAFGCSGFRRTAPKTQGVLSGFIKDGLAIFQGHRRHFFVENAVKVTGTAFRFGLFFKNRLNRFFRVPQMRGCDQDFFKELLRRYRYRCFLI